MEENQETMPGPDGESIFTEEDFSTRPYEKHIKRARVILFILAGIYLIYGIFLMFRLDLTRIMALVFIGGYLALGGTNIMLALWTKKKPYTALIIALVLYLSVIVLNSIINPSNIISGLLIKIAIVAMLIRGMRNGKEAQDMMETFGKKP